MHARTAMIMTAALALVSLTSPTASAAGPANDEIANATVVTSIPYAVDEDISGSTKTPGDPKPSCDRRTKSNVWWTVTPASSGWLVADTKGSKVPTVAAVYTGSPGALTEVACNDDSYRDDHWSSQARVYWEATAGTEYYLLIAKDYGRGGPLRLAVDQTDAPFRVDSLSIDSSGSVNNQTGIAVVTGTVTCSGGSGEVYLDAFARQRIGRVYISDRSSKSLVCDGETPWRMRFRSYEGLFTGGRLEVSPATFWRAGNGGYVEGATATVMLHG